AAHRAPDRHASRTGVLPAAAADVVLGAGFDRQADPAHSRRRDPIWPGAGLLPARHRPLHRGPSARLTIACRKSVKATLRNSKFLKVAFTDLPLPLPMRRAGHPARDAAFGVDAL